MKGKILVTGGAGYIGSHTLRALEAAGFEPICLDNLSTGFREFAGNTPFVKADLADRAALDSVFTSHSVQAVIHFASHALVEESCRNPHKYYHDNILNSLNLLEAMRGGGVQRVVFSSSCATYGIPDRVPITESNPRDPVNPYGVTKMVIERILEDYGRAYGIRFVALRYFNAAGAAADGSIGEWHDPESHLIPRLFEAALGRSEGAHIYGDDYPTKDGTCVRDYIHVDDLASAHLASIEHLTAGHPSDFFNLGTGVGLTVLEVLDQVMRTTGRKFPVKRLPRRAGDPAALVADASKANRVLGWKARHSSIEEIVETAWNWHKRKSTGS